MTAPDDKGPDATPAAPASQDAHPGSNKVANTATNSEAENDVAGDRAQDAASRGPTAEGDAEEGDRQDASGAPRTSPRARAFAIAVLLVGAVCSGMGQTIVFSVLPPLARELGLPEIKVGLIFMISAICWVTLGPRWGRLSDALGRKPFIVTGLAAFGVSMLFFGGSVELGLAGVLSGLPLYLTMVLARSLYGVLGSAGPPAAQAYIADRTSAADRTAGIAGFSAAFGFGAMLGPGFGAAASVFGKTAPFFAISALAFVMSAAVIAFLPERTAPTRRMKGPRLRPTDRRIAPFLIYGLVFGVINAIPIQTVAFYFIDALGFSTDLAPQIVGVGLMGGAMASLFSQLVIVQRLRLTPATLMRVAPALFALGHLLIAALPHLGVVVFGMVLAGFGAGLAAPGFNAAASLAVRPEEQGAAIGLANAAGASGFIVAPLVGFWLYGVAPQAPYLFTMTLALVLFAYAWRSRAVREARPHAVAEDDAGRDPAAAPYR